MLHRQQLLAVFVCILRSTSQLFASLKAHHNWLHPKKHITIGCIKKAHHNLQTKSGTAKTGRQFSYTVTATQRGQQGPQKLRRVPVASVSCLGSAREGAGVSVYQDAFALGNVLRNRNASARRQASRLEHRGIAFHRRIRFYHFQHHCLR